MKTLKMKKSRGITACLKKVHLERGLKLEGDNRVGKCHKGLPIICMDLGPVHLHSLMYLNLCDVHTQLVLLHSYDSF